MRGWKWLFITEGLIAICIGIVGFMVLPDYPHNTRFLSSEERHVAIKRLEVQGKKVIATGFNMATLHNVCATPYIYLFIIIFICHHIGIGILQQFAIILREMGYDASFANYMTVPIYIVAVYVHQYEHPLFEVNLLMWITLDPSSSYKAIYRIVTANAICTSRLLPPLLSSLISYSLLSIMDMFLWLSYLFACTWLCHYSVPYQSWWHGITKSIKRMQVGKGVTRLLAIYWLVGLIHRNTCTRYCYC